VYRCFFLFDCEASEGSRQHSYLRPLVGAGEVLLARMRDARGEPIVDSGLKGPRMLSALPHVGRTRGIIG
jgi:hypothetical protein